MAVTDVAVEGGSGYGAYAGSRCQPPRHALRAKSRRGETKISTLQKAITHSGFPGTGDTK